jgi:murein DD-endopeptidase MepM/ murein hydrolase activator NlpD
MINKYSVIFLFFLIWGSVLSSCKNISHEEKVKLNENLKGTSTPKTKTFQNQPSLTVIQNSPTLPPNLVTPPLEKNELVLAIGTPTLVLTELNSPLDGIELQELSDIVSNPFFYTGYGKDDGHHGTDFSFYDYKSYEKIENLPVLSITSGRVSSVIYDRPPYGNLVMVETPFSSLPFILRNHLLLLLPEIEIPFHTNLSCPDYQLEEEFQISEPFSLYILYAHLSSPPEVQIESQVFSGNPIGKVGNSGSSGNPHLHLEFRIGPSGYNFEEMSHYNNTATQNEIFNYCLWRVSGLFYQVDPMESIEYYLQNR